MKTDIKIKWDIENELEWDSRLDHSSINVEVKEGHVVLYGSIDSYPKKIWAEEAARKNIWIRSVSNELKVEIPSAFRKADHIIKKAVLDAIKWNSSTPEDRIGVEVKDGWVFLSGNVDWQYQQSKARLLATDISGVTGVTNDITINPQYIRPRYSTGQDR